MPIELQTKAVALKVLCKKGFVLLMLVFLLA
jgi:hypothetical protein